MRFQIQVIQRRLFFLLELSISYPMLKLNSQQWPRANDFPSSKPLFHQQIFVRFRIKIYSYYFQHDNTYPAFYFHQNSWHSPRSHFLNKWGPCVYSLALFMFLFIFSFCNTLGSQEFIQCVSLYEIKHDRIRYKILLCLNNVIS